MAAKKKPAPKKATKDVAKPPGKKRGPKVGKPQAKHAPARTVGEWKGVFLKYLAVNGNIKEACEKAGVSRPTVYDLREKDPEFARAWEVAHQEALDGLEQVGWERARMTSDRLLEFFLKRWRPEYREKYSADLNVSGGLKHETELVLEQRQRFVVGIIDKVLAGEVGGELLGLVQGATGGAENPTQGHDAGPVAGGEPAGPGGGADG